MAIAQMNWGRLKYSPIDHRLADFNSALSIVYKLAEAHKGFIWRVPDADAAAELLALGHDERMSATVSVWRSIDDLHDFTFAGLHGDFLRRKNEWFEAVEEPQLAIWNVDHLERPSFRQAFERLEHLKQNGDGAFVQGWPDHLRQ
ncbi:MAG: DUF3291 domain-containing protein [Geminicoccaceae bacterium]